MFKLFALIIMTLLALPCYGGRTFKLYDLPAPNYPAKCLEQGIEGTVMLKLRITSLGKIKSVDVARAPLDCPEFEAAAIAAVKRAKFYAPPRGQHLQDQIIMLPVTFSIDPS